MPLDPSLDPNAEFMVKLGGGESTLRVYLDKRRKRPPVEPETAEERTEGLLPASHGEVKLHGGPKFINFYDMGRKWNGSQFVDVDYSVPITYTEAISGVESYKANANPTLSELEALTDLIIDYDISDIERMHPRIAKTEGEYFKLLLGDVSLNPTQAHESDLWTDKGWKVNPALLRGKTNLVVGATAEANDSNVNDKQASPFFHKIVLTGASTNLATITRVNDPGGPAVTYTPKGGDKIFLMPSLPRPNGWCGYRDIGTNHGLVTSDLRNVHGYESFDWAVTPRTPIFDSTSPYYLVPFRDTASNNVWNWNPSSTTQTDADVLRFAGAMRLINFIESYGTNQYLREAVNQSGTFNDYAWHPYVGTGFPPSSFFTSETVPPTISSSPLSWITGSGGFFGTSLMSATAPVSSANPSLPTGALMAIIKQGSKIFYVWR